MDRRHERRARWRGWLEGARVDARIAVRALLRRPAVAVASVVTLAVGVGGTLTVLALAEGILHRPLPYREYERLVHVEGAEGGRLAFSMPDYHAIRDGSRALEASAVWQGWRVVLPTEDGLRVRLPAASVSADFFRLLGVRPAVGRLFGAEDAGVGHVPTVILSHETWLRHFEGRPDVLGEMITVDGTGYAVVGVLPPDFVDPVGASLGGSERALWRSEPPEFQRGEEDPGWIAFWVIGRLRPGATPEAARAEISRILQERGAEATGQPEVRVVTFLDALTRSVRPTLVALLAAVGVVLLIACVNVANLLLSSGVSRAREFAVRASIGAARGRLVRQLLTESLVLAGVGTLFGLCVALAGTWLLLHFFGTQLPRADAVAPNLTLGAVAVAMAFLTGLLFGIVPALQLSAHRLAEMLREGGRTEAGHRRAGRIQNLLVVLETGLAIVLLAGAGILLRTLWNLNELDPGFETAGVVTVNVGLPADAFPEPERQTLVLQEILERIGSRPGVSGAAAITDLPMSGNVNSTWIPAPGSARGEEGVQTLVRAVTPGYHPLLEIPLLGGRGIEEGDGAGGEPVAVVNREFGRRMFSGQDPVGRVVSVRGVSRRIVGVVEDVQEFSLTGAKDPVLYLPYAQEREGWMREAVNLLVRTTGPVEGVEPLIRSAVLAVSPQVPVQGQATLSSLVDRERSAPRLRAVVLGLLAGVALLLAAVGLAGVMAHSVARRRREMGVRQALGAAPGQVLRLVLRRAGALTAAGIGIGMLGTWAVMRLASGLLYGVAPLDPAVLLGSVLVLGGAGMLASYLPARRAAAVDPAEALRQE